MIFRFLVFTVQAPTFQSPGDFFQGPGARGGGARVHIANLEPRRGHGVRSMLDMSSDAVLALQKSFFRRSFEPSGRGHWWLKDDAAERCVRSAWYLSRARWSHDCILLRCSRQPRRELQHARDHRRCFWLLVALEGTAPVAAALVHALSAELWVMCCSAHVL